MQMYACATGCAKQLPALEKSNCGNWISELTAATTYTVLRATSRLIPTAAGSSCAATQQQCCNKKGGKAEGNDCSWEGLSPSHKPMPAQLINLAEI